MPITEEQSQALIEAVREVAAEEIVPRFRALDAADVDEKSTFDDLVTVADRAAEAALTERVRAILPGDGVVGEEAVSADRTLLDRVGEGRQTIIDPIDGTWNFAHGNANYGVIVAVIEDGRTVWGLLYDPSFDDWIEASLGGGAAFVRGGRTTPLRVSTEDVPLDRLRGNVGHYMFTGTARRGLASAAHLMRRSTSLGASVHEYRMQAQGHTDFCLNGMLNVWDHAAGVLALREAGGVARLLDGRDYAPAMREGALLTARTERMWSALADTFNEALGGDGLAKV
jgi:fructose-1,6-bisphosphatase/inositol monophosphatase family enzyme